MATRGVAGSVRRRRGKTEEHRGGIVAKLNDCDPILTVQISKFHIETWNLAKMKVVEEEKFYNIDVGQKLIWVLDLGENRGQNSVKIWNLTKHTWLTLMTMLKWWLAANIWI